MDKIITASYLPEKVVTNQEIIDAGLNSTAAALERGLGVKERRAAASDETGAEMMTKVAKKILNKAGLLPQELDRILCSTEPQDAGAPDTACRVQALLGATCPAYGVSMSCTGWVAAVDIALGYLARKEKRILVLASSLVGSRLYYHNLMHRAIFGDGAGGILLETRHLSNFLAIGEIADGKYYSEIFVPYPWSQKPTDVPDEYKGSFYMSPNQKRFFSLLEHYLPKFVKRILEEAKVKLEDISLFLMHYPSKPLFEHSLKLLGIPRSKTFHNFKHYGNLVSAEMPVFLDEVIQAGKIKEGDLIFMLPYGAGVTMGGLIMRY
jgi:3-oxoacyl-[acyl-carrier-protein] synthase-3